MGGLLAVGLPLGVFPAVLDGLERYPVKTAIRTVADPLGRDAKFARLEAALEDVELGGVQIKKGQRVVMSYRSANFDEEVFENPHKFDILRDPNPHVGFGGTGAHYCIGANLAKMEVRLIFDALADLAPGISKAGEPKRLRHAWINGIKDLQVRYR